MPMEVNQKENQRQRGERALDVGMKQKKLGVGSAMASISLLLWGLSMSACTGDGGGAVGIEAAESCMTCHNGSPDHNDYAGPGLEDPHPFGDAANMLCTTCHGGNPDGVDALSSHVPPPPQIGDREFRDQNAFAFFNKLTLTGIDRLPDYTVDGVTYSAVDYLQFLNPGDLRVTKEGRGCGQCHSSHSRIVEKSPLATSTGVMSGATFAAGIENQIAAHVDQFEDTASDLAFRAVAENAYSFNPLATGRVESLIEFPVFGTRNDPSPDAIHGNTDYRSANLPSGQGVDNRAMLNSPLANLWHEQVSTTCGDCHLGSAGANNRFGDFRSSGCTACHMPYSPSGRSGSGDPNFGPGTPYYGEPQNPDAIDDPERAHVRRHRILSVAQTIDGEFQPGIDDMTCAGCHQGSNRTVMQFWGIRLDQNQDVRRGHQYPTNPASYVNTSGDPRLFDPDVGNNTFNGRNRNQYLAFEDYDGDGRDDTPADVHHEAGMGCIDCHGSYDLHGGDASDPDDGIASRMEQAVAIRCINCHGTATTYATTQTGTTYLGETAELAVDDAGNALRHVYDDGSGHFYLRSRLTGNLHYVKQTRDTVVDNGKLHPFTNEPIYSAKASFAMGRADGDPSTGLGPLQTAGHSGFSHADDMSCEACHSSWTNNCIGCHLEGEFDNGNNFSNITGDRVVFDEKNADFVYQSPVFFQLGIGPRNQITPISPNTQAFFQYFDDEGTPSDTFCFADRNGRGNTDGDFGSLSHNVMMPHSIRGKVELGNEGPRYCNACHLTDTQLANFGSEYATFRTAMATDDYASLDFNLLAAHIGANTNNAIDSPLWVHMAAGLGSGLFLFDENGCPINPLDDDANRKGCDNGAPSANFDLGNVALNLDRLVRPNGVPTAGNTHPLLNPGAGPNLRDGAPDPNMSGPLGANLIERLTDPATGIVLDSWLDSDGAPRGDASTHLDD